MKRARYQRGEAIIALAFLGYIFLLMVVGGVIVMTRSHADNPPSEDSKKSTPAVTLPKMTKEEKLAKMRSDFSQYDYEEILKSEAMEKMQLPSEDFRMKDDDKDHTAIIENFINIFCSNIYHHRVKRQGPKKNQKTSQDSTRSNRINYCGPQYQPLIRFYIRMRLSERRSDIGWNLQQMIENWRNSVTIDLTTLRFARQPDVDSRIYLIDNFQSQFRQAMASLPNDQSFFNGVEISRLINGITTPIFYATSMLALGQRQVSPRGANIIDQVYDVEHYRFSRQIPGLAENDTVSYRYIVINNHYPIITDVQHLIDLGHNQIHIDEVTQYIHASFEPSVELNRFVDLLDPSDLEVDNLLNPNNSSALVVMLMVNDSPVLAAFLNIEWGDRAFFNVADRIINQNVPNRQNYLDSLTNMIGNVLYARNVSTLVLYNLQPAQQNNPGDRPLPSGPNQSRPRPTDPPPPGPSNRLPIGGHQSSS